MKTLIRLSLTTAACALVLCANSLDASASPTWQTIPGAPKGHAAVSVSDGSFHGYVYFLGSTWLPGGWQLQGYDFRRPTLPVFNVDDGLYHLQGTSLTVDRTGKLWLITAYNAIDPDPGVPSTACEGGPIDFRQEGGHNNLAVRRDDDPSHDEAFYVIDGNGRIRRALLNIYYLGPAPLPPPVAGCWALEPELPSGAVANDISVKLSDGNVWAADASGAVFVLSPGRSVVSGGQQSIIGASWQSLDGSNGHVKFLGGNYRTSPAAGRDVAVGFDNMSLYNWSDTTEWTWDPDWQHWQFLHFGTSIIHQDPSEHFVDEVAVGLENTIWAKVNQ